MVRVQFLRYSGHFLLKVENFIFDPITKFVQYISMCNYIMMVFINYILMSYEH